MTIDELRVETEELLAGASSFVSRSGVLATADHESSMESQTPKKLLKEEYVYRYLDALYKVSKRLFLY